MEEDTAELAARAEKYRRELLMLVEKMLDGWVRLALDDDLRIVAASSSYYRMTGYTRAESLAPPLNGRMLHLIVPEDLPVVLGALAHLAETGEAVSARYRLRRKDGSLSWKRSCCASLLVVNGERVIDVFVQDLTDEQNTQQELSDLIDHIPGGVVRALVSATEKTIVYANSTFYRQIGYTPETFVTGPPRGDYLQVVHPEDRKLFQAGALRKSSAEGSFTLDYRIITAAGEVRWMNGHLMPVRQGQGRTRYLCIFTDTTAERQERLQSALNEERYRIISEQTRDTVFEWDLATDLVQFSPMYEKMFGFPPPPDLPIGLLTQSDIIYEEDKPLVDQIIREVHAGKPYAEATYRARCADGSYLWCRNRITTIFDDHKQPIHAIGVLTDIHDLKVEAATLKERAMRDSMTGLLNRGALQSAVETLLAAHPAKQHAFLQFDVDHFKQINDFMGHGAGDTALQQIAQLLRERFGEAVCGRMGGDEFAIFLADIPSIAYACQEAEAICAAIHGELHSGSKIYPLTVSLGIALYPEHGRTYQKLYERADGALYHAKRNGGDGYFLYSLLDKR